ncbi:MAG: hypothetical protein APF76_17570 [Desulfitibacter sp. BRH_c19]|nr:MAG: hypothetical protein APF76_17570 [Desulfitibacter sp. BRH_c19]
MVRLSSKEKERLFATFPEQNPNPVFCVAIDGAILYSNNACKEICINVYSELDAPLMEAIITVIKGKGVKNNLEFTIGEKIYAFTVVPISETNVAFVYGSDISKHREAQANLKQLTKIIDESINIVFITDYDGLIEYVNTTFEKITGFKKEECIGANPRFLASGDRTLAEYKIFWDEIKLGKTWRGIFKNKTKDGKFYWANGFVSPIRDENGIITNFLAIQEDITNKIVTEERLNYLSNYDETTGLINRATFIELLDRYLASCNGKSAAMLLINIDGFKLINDSFGSNAGDDFLKSFAEFLTTKVNEIDIVFGSKEKSIVGRLGGDDFAVLLPSRYEKESICAAESIRKAVEGHRFLNGSLRTTASIGITLYPNHGKTSRELFAQCNDAIIHAKELGQNRYFIYSKGDTYLDQVYSTIKEKGRILTALEEDRILPWFQPILNLRSGEINHYEALARLLENDGTVVPPNHFIPTAERYGLISSIDRIITKKSLDMQSKLKEKGRKISFSMNLSAKHLADEHMLDFLQETISKTKADYNSVVFELTETAAIQNMSRAIYFVKALKEMGCKFSLDDFGVGYTSFAQLIEMEVDFLKIDGSFVRHLPDSKRNRILVKTIAEMAQGLGIQTIAEFVDREETLQIVKEIGIDYAQGYLIGKPSPFLVD